MHQINQSIQFNPRMTMPSNPTRLYLKNIYNTQQRTQKIYSDTYLNSTNSVQINSNTFFVRISKQSLEEQKRIYRQRINCNEQFIHISNFKLQSQGNCYNPNLLYKIQLAIPKSNFMAVKDLNLTKCINILKGILNGVIVLLQYFDPVILTQKMIYLTQQGMAKIWMDQRFYMNPNNQLYTKSNKKITQKQCLDSITEIIKQKCLKTKLSQKLFKNLEDIDSINNCITAIQNFQLEQKLFSVQGLKYSASTGTGLTLLNTTCSLQFSTNNIMKKRKTITLTDKDKSQQKNNRNIASHGFLQHKSMKININQFNLNKQRDGKITYKSQYKTQQKQQNQLSPHAKSHLDIKGQKPVESMVISQLFISNNQIGQQLQKQKKIQQNPQKQSYPLKIRKTKSYQPTINQQTNMQTILQRNGWNPKILSLFNGKNVKESFSEGKQINLQFKGFQLKKLHTMGKQLRQSILPVQEQFDQS